MDDAAHPNPYTVGLDRNAANFVALSPLGFIARTAAVHPKRLAVIHGERRYDWAETYRRCRRLASALTRRGIGRNDTVAVMGANTPELLEAHFGVPMAGAVLNALNIRLDADTIAFILQHGEAKVLITDREFSAVIEKALAQLARRPLVIDIDDALAPPGKLLGEIDYESFLAEGDEDAAWSMPDDEWNAIALNYTSGTTGNPKGVVYHHRGAYLNALGNALVWSLKQHPVYLWTLPMFHCNGWCFPWTITALAGTHVCLRRVEAPAVFAAIAGAGVTHLCGAPVVMNMLLNAPAAQLPKLDRRIALMTAASPPPAAVIEGMERLGFDITHVYGLTEVYGPAVVCDWHEDWDALPAADRATLKSRQGVRYPVLEGLTVADPATLAPVAADGTALGEVFMRGNVVMKGYLKNQKATDESFAGGSEIPIGRPVANTRIYVLDRYMNPVPVGVVGEICVAAAHLARGYLNRPDLTEERFIPDPFSAEAVGTEQRRRLYRTGDLGRFRSNGEIEFIGRTDHQVKINGFRIDLPEVERVLASHIGVSEAVAAVREIGNGQRLVAYIVAKPIGTPSASQLRRYLQDRLSDYMIPARFVFLKELPKLGSGTVDRHALPAPEPVRPHLETHYQPPGSPMEAAIAQIWSDLLGLDPIGIHDPFRDLGGDSMSAADVALRLGQRLGIDITPEALLERPTIAELAVYLSGTRVATTGA